MDKYILLADCIYAPKEVDFKFGPVVTIDKVVSGEGIHFSLVNSNIKGRVANPEMFAENTKENRKKVSEYVKLSAEASRKEKQANRIINSIEILHEIPNH